MHWIMDWCKLNCTRQYDCDRCKSYICPPRFKLAEQAECSEHLIWMLVNCRGAVTHPNIADRIADVTGATSAQRDTLVVPKHHGTYVPASELPDGAARKRKTPSFAIPVLFTQPNSRAVVVVDRTGAEVLRYSTVRQATERLHCSEYAIRSRASRVEADRDEFDALSVTFRFADEWDKMTQEERLNDISKKAK